MLKKMLEVMMVAIIVAGVAGAFFRLAGSLPISVTQTQKTSTFDASGDGKVVVVPDQAMISMGVQEEGFNLKEVQEMVNKKMTSLSNELKAMGIDEKDIKTIGYNYYPDYQTKGKYRAYATVSVRVRELGQVSPVMDLIGTLGLDDVNGPSFGLSDELSEKTIKEARKIAIEDAKAKADELSKLAGMNLGRIVNVTEGSNAPQPYIMRDALPMTGGGLENAKISTPIEAGSSEVRISVTLSYETR